MRKNTPFLALAYKYIIIRFIADKNMFGNLPKKSQNSTNHLLVRCTHVEVKKMMVQHRSIK
jgi:hypothetical protein